MLKRKLLLLLVLQTVAVFGLQAQNWNGSVSTDWNDPNNWTPASIPTSAVITGSPANYPTLTADVNVDKITIKTDASASAKINLAGFNLTVKELVIQSSGNKRQILSSGGALSVTQKVAISGSATQNVDIFPATTFQLTLKDSDVYHTTFHGTVTATYANPNNEVSKWGGNTFKENANINLDGKGKWYWGYNAGDIFEKDVVIDATDNLSAVTSGTYRKDNYNTNNQKFPTDYQTSYPTSGTPFLPRPFYQAGSGNPYVPTPPLAKVGFPDYPRPDNLPTGGSLDQTTSNANSAANQTAKDLNKADEDLSFQNEKDANQTCIDAYSKSAIASVHMNGVLNNINNAIDASEPAYTDPSVTALYNALKTKRDAFVTARTAYEAKRQDHHDKTAHVEAQLDSKHKSADAYYTMANDLGQATHDYTVQGNDLTAALDALYAAVNAVNRAHNATLTADLNTSATSGQLEMAYNSTGNLFKGKVTASINAKATLKISNHTNGGATFKDDVEITNMSLGRKETSSQINFALGIGATTSTQAITFEKNLTVNNGDGAASVGSAYIGKHPITVQGNLTINSEANSKNTIADNITLNGLLTTKIEGEAFQLNRFESTNPAAITVDVKNDCNFKSTGTFKTAGDLTVIDNTTKVVDFASHVTVGGNTSLRNLETSNNNAIKFSNKADFNGNIQIENAGIASDNNSPIYIKNGTLASGKSISILPGGFKNGVFYLDGFTQLGSDAINLTFPDKAVFRANNATFNGNVTVEAGCVDVMRSTLNGDVHFTRNANTGNVSGKNTFNGKVTYINKAKGEWKLAHNSLGADTYNDECNIIIENGHMRFWSASTYNGKVNVIHRGTAGDATKVMVNFGWYGTNIFKDEVTIDMQTDAQLRYTKFSAQSGSTEFHKTVKVTSTTGTKYKGNYLFGGDPSEGNYASSQTKFLSGSNLIIEGDMEKSQTWLWGVISDVAGGIKIDLPQTSIETGNIIQVRHSQFNSSFTAKASDVFVKENVFNEDATFEKKGSAVVDLGFWVFGKPNVCFGGNTFKGETHIISTSKSTEKYQGWFWATQKPDIFLNNVTYKTEGKGFIYPAMSGDNIYKGNINIEGSSANKIFFGGDPSYVPSAALGNPSNINKYTGQGLNPNVVINASGSNQDLNINTTDAAAIPSFYKIEMRQGSGNLRFNIKGKDIEVRNFLDLKLGKIYLGDHNMYILNEEAPNSVSEFTGDESYVIATGKGSVVRTVPNKDVIVLFPVGDENTYTPAKLNGKSGTSDIYRVRVISDVYVDYEPSYAPVAGTEIDDLKGSFTDRTWIITEDTPGGSNLDILLQWNETDHQGQFDPSKDHIAVVYFDQATKKWTCTQPRDADTNFKIGAYNAFYRVTNYNQTGIFSVGSIDAEIENDDAKLCGSNPFQLQANELVLPFEGEWSVQSIDGAAPPASFDQDAFFGTAADRKKHNPILNNLVSNTTYILRWTNKGLLGDCGVGLYDEMKIEVGNLPAFTGTFVTWDGSETDAWGDCRNWTPEYVPTSTLDAVIPDLSSSTVPGNSGPVVYKPGAAKSIDIQQNSSLTNKSTLTVEGDIDVAQGSKITNEANPLIGATNVIEIKQNLNLNHATVTLTNVESMIIGGNIVNNGTIKTLINAGVEDAIFKLSGDLNNAGTANIEHGDFVLEGANASAISGNQPSFKNLTVDKDAVVDITLSTNIEVKGKLGLRKGIVAVPTAGQMVILTKEATSDQGKNESYVRGRMRKFINNSATAPTNSFIFPIGKSVLGRIAITEVTNQQDGDYFTAEYYENQYSDLTVAASNPPYPKLHHVSILEYWILDRSATNASKTNAKVMLYWTSYTKSDIHNPTKNAGVSDLMVAHYTGTEWRSRGGIVNEAAQTLVTPAVQTEFSPWTFSTNTGFNPLPVRLLSFDARKQSKYNLINWTTENDPITVKFEVQRSIDNLNFNTFSSVDAKTSNQPVISYKAFDEKQHEGPVYYRLKMIDKDGKIAYSKVITLTQDAVAKAQNVYPNPFKDIISTTFSLKEGAEYVINVKDMLGRTVYTAKHVSVGDNTVELNLSALPKGTYVLEVVGNDQLIREKIIKE